MKMNETILSRSVEETFQLGKIFVENLFTSMWKNKGEAVIIQLRGDLGSGKTTFVQSVAKALGIRNTVTSPTFVLEKIYKIPEENGKKTGFEQLIHIDAYRLSEEEDLGSIGWGEIIRDPRNLIFVEWPERIPEAFPSEISQISFRFIDKEKREIIFSLYPTQGSVA